MTADQAPFTGTVTADALPSMGEVRRRVRQDVLESPEWLLTDLLLMLSDAGLGVLVSSLNPLSCICPSFFSVANVWFLLAGNLIVMKLAPRCRRRGHGTALPRLSSRGEKTAMMCGRSRKSPSAAGTTPG